MGHESLESYYRQNQRLLFRVRGDFEQNLTLTELENMMPYERTAYLLLFEQRMLEHEREKQQKK